MLNSKRNWSSTSLLDVSVYSRLSKENSSISSSKNDFFPNNETIEEKEGPRFIIHPDSSWKLAWDTVCFMIILYQAISIPFYLTFMLDASITALSSVDLCFMIFFMFDILFYFNSAFFRNGDLIVNRKEIIKNYMKSWFWIDLISTFPYDTLYNYLNIRSHSLSSAPQLLRIIRFYRVLKLLRLARLKRLFVQIEDYINSETLTNFLTIFKLMIFAFYIAHWTACLWYYISLQESETHAETWLTQAYFETGSTAEIYVTALYWAFTTMATVGYGDIVPITQNETIFALIAALVSCAMFAYTIGSIGVLVSKYSEDERIYRDKCISINAFLKQKKIPLDLRFKARRYMEYIWDQFKMKTIGENEILQLLSDPLREEIFVYTRGSMLNTCVIFKKFTAHFIQQIGKILESHTFAPSDMIFEEGEMSSSMFFIRTGEIELYQHSTGTVLKLLKSGKFCGEIALFCQTPRCCSARSVDFLESLILDQKNFEEVLEKIPEAYRLYEYIRTRCEKGDLSALDVNCYLCAELGHVATSCKQFHLNVNDELLKNKWIKSRSHLTKLINPHDPRFNQKYKKRRNHLKNYNVSNVIGVERSQTDIFKENEELKHKIHTFFSFQNEAIHESTQNSDVGHATQTYFHKVTSSPN